MLPILLQSALAAPDCSFELANYQGAAVVEVGTAPPAMVSVDARHATGVLAAATLAGADLALTVEDETVALRGTTRSGVLSLVSARELGGGLRLPASTPVAVASADLGWQTHALPPPGYTPRAQEAAALACSDLAFLDLEAPADPPGESRRLGPGLVEVVDDAGGPLGRFSCGEPGCTNVWVDRTDGARSHVTTTALAAAQLQGWIPTSALMAAPELPKTVPAPSLVGLRGLRCPAGALTTAGPSPKPVAQLKAGAAVLAGPSADGWTSVVLPDAAWLKGRFALPDEFVQTCRSDVAVVPLEDADPTPVLGALDRSLIDEVIKRHMNQIRYCYQRSLVRSPQLAGSVKIRFVIERDGRVSSAATRETTMNAPEVETCIEGRFTKMLFPAPKNEGTVIVSYPFVFSPG
jgi:hypothetical protein